MPIHRSTTLTAPLSVLAAAIAVSVGCQQAGRTDGHVGHHHEEEHVELAKIMGEMQRHSMKLGYAIQGENQKLADFYLHEIEETLDEIKAVKEHDGLPIGATAGTIMDPAIEPLEAAVDAGDWPASRAAYRGLIEACNNCHTATEHEYIVIIPAEGTPPFNQKF